MVDKLKKKMIFLIISILFLVSCCIILSINYVNRRNIERSAYEALDLIELNGGKRPGFGGMNQEMDDKKPPLPDLQANLGNFYVIDIDENGNVIDWNSDRSDLYDSQTVENTAKAVLGKNNNQGHIETNFYKVSEKLGNKHIFILNQSIEYQNAKNVLLYTTFVVLAACIVLSVISVFFVNRFIKPVSEAFSKQKQFIADASHELKTPLAVISANADVLEDELGKNESIDYIRSEVQRADKLIKSMLELARMDSETYRVEKENINLSEEILNILLPFEASIYEKGKHLEFDIPDSVLCYCNKDMIQQLISILLSNALKYSDEESLIYVKLCENKKYKNIVVINKCTGINQECLDHVFDRFYRGDESHNREVEGYGLGLSIAHDIVSLHNGKIHASCNRDIVNFDVLLP